MAARLIIIVEHSVDSHPLEVLFWFDYSSLVLDNRPILVPTLVL